MLVILVLSAAVAWLHGEAPERFQTLTPTLFTCALLLHRTAW